jgi:hypothetical protein
MPFSKERTSKERMDEWAKARLGHHSGRVVPPTAKTREDIEATLDEARVAADQYQQAVHAATRSKPETDR